MCEAEDAHREYRLLVRKILKKKFPDAHLALLKEERKIIDAKAEIAFGVKRQ